MSVSLQEVLENAGFDVENDYDDALWLLEQQSDFDELIESAKDLEDDYADYEYFVEQQEELGITEVPTFKEWREEVKKNTEEK